MSLLVQTRSDVSAALATDEVCDGSGDCSLELRQLRGETETADLELSSTDDEEDQDEGEDSKACSWTGPYNTDIPGTGLGGSVAADVGACTQRCIDNAVCKAIQYSPTDTHQGNNCFIFDNQEDTGAQFKSFQIYKMALCTSSFSEMAGTDVALVTVSGSTDAALDEACCSQCTSNAQCQFWVRESGSSGNKKCWLKKDAGAQSTKDNRRGGYPQAGAWKKHCAAPQPQPQPQPQYQYRYWPPAPAPPAAPAAAPGATNPWAKMMGPNVWKDPNALKKMMDPSMWTR
eukprot:TRINITY_DN7445_c0_g1_i5.p1 TRINITY_DN7445_c0_g1~~TRINITY_DN7445_c0_g1_i5.p1  ORF type:complete len:287 (-),score=59.12 TRINITY_DN7445_c0_g1_i5:288-1148(-)